MRKAAAASTFVLLSLAGCGSDGHQRAAPARPRSASTRRANGPRPLRVAPHETGPANAQVPHALIGHVPTVLPTRRRVVALTFDAGANDAGLPKIAAALRRLRVPATFFMTGHFARFYPGWARSVAARYPIGNHTMNHLDLNGLSDAHVRREVVGGQEAIRRVTGRDPQPLFRFPYGSDSARTVRIVNSLGYASVGWTVDTGGWLGTSGGQSVAGVVARTLRGLRPGAIILMHVGSNPGDGSTLDADGLATMIRRIESRGYRFTTLPAIYAAAYTSWRIGRGSDGAISSAALSRFLRLGLPLYCGAARRRYVALTFDDGPGPATAAALALLRRFRDRATFFLVGRNLARWPRLPRAELERGVVGDHTWTHPYLTRLAPPEMDSEIARTQAAVARATRAPVRLFRPPYGFRDAAIDREARRLGMLDVLWSVDSGDSYPPPGASAGTIVRTLARLVRPGSILLMHENRRQTMSALPAVLRALRARGFRAVTVPELLAFDPPSLAQLRAGFSGCKG